MEPSVLARTRKLMFVVLCVGLFAVSAMAQLTTADVAGTVTDSSGAALPNAKVTLTNTATNEARGQQTNGSGEYTFTFLQPGRYSVRVEAPGFKTFSSTIDISAGNRARVDAAMQLGNTSESVDVTALSPLMQTESSTVQNSIPTQHVESLPLATRNLTNLVEFVPGANEASNVDSLSSGQRPDDRRLTSSFSVNGQDVEFNNETIDGTDNNERIIGTIGVKP